MFAAFIIKLTPNLYGQLETKDFNECAMTSQKKEKTERERVQHN